MLTSSSDLFAGSQTIPPWPSETPGPPSKRSTMPCPNNNSRSQPRDPRLYPAHPGRSLCRCALVCSPPRSDSVPIPFRSVVCFPIRRPPMSGQQNNTSSSQWRTHWSQWSSWKAILRWLSDLGQRSRRAVVPVARITQCRAPALAYQKSQTVKSFLDGTSPPRNLFVD